MNHISHRNGWHTFFFALALVWICVIWGQSLMPGNLSSQESGAVLRSINGWLSAHGLAPTTEFFVRKTAHFLEYALLGGLLTLSALCSARPLRRCLVRMVPLLVAIPCVDEGIQLLTDGRAARIADVCLDLCGALCGVGVLCALHWLGQALRRI